VSFRPCGWSSEAFGPVLPSGRHLGPADGLGGQARAARPNMKLIGIVHDDPDVTPPDKVRYDAAVTVNRPMQSEGDFGVMEFPEAAMPW